MAFQNLGSYLPKPRRSQYSMSPQRLQGRIDGTTSEVYLITQEIKSLRSAPIPSRGISDLNVGLEVPSHLSQETQKPGHFPPLSSSAGECRIPDHDKLLSAVTTKVLRSLKSRKMSPQSFRSPSPPKLLHRASRKKSLLDEGIARIESPLKGKTMTLLNKGIQHKDRAPRQKDLNDGQELKGTDKADMPKKHHDPGRLVKERGSPTSLKQQADCQELIFLQGKKIHPQHSQSVQGKRQPSLVQEKGEERETRDRSPCRDSETCSLLLQEKPFAERKARVPHTKPRVLESKKNPAALEMLTWEDYRHTNPLVRGKLQPLLQAYPKEEPPRKNSMKHKWQLKAPIWDPTVRGNQGSKREEISVNRLPFPVGKDYDFLKNPALVCDVLMGVYHGCSSGISETPSTPSHSQLPTFENRSMPPYRR